MTITCTTTGAWDAVKTKGFRSLTEQEWQAAMVYVLCQTKAALNGGSMANCTVAGVWDAIKGATRFKTDQEFYAESLKIMCDVATLIAAGGGGGGSGSVLVYDNHAALPASPPVPTSPAIARFRDGSAGLTWDPVGADWF